MRYGMWRKMHGGGCDYTIACGQEFSLLPKEIQTMFQAIEYATSKDEDNEEGDRAINEDISHCIIYEIANIHKIDINAVLQERKDKENAEAEENAKAERKAQLKRLKEEFPDG